MNLKHVQNPKLIIWFGAWFIPAVLLLQGNTIADLSTQVLIVVVAISWFYLNKILIKEIEVPVEIAVFSFIVLQFLDLQLLNLFDQEILSGDYFFLIKIIHQVLIVLQVLAFALVLTQNNKNKQYIIIFYVLIGLLAHFFVYREQTIIQFIFYFWMFFLLLKRTSWINKIDKRTLGIYFFFFIALFFLVMYKSSFLTSSWSELPQNELWYTLPKFLLDILLIYCLTIIIKIPGVIIYNHITLARKLWFAGIFQSVIPQFAQLVLVIVLSYFFVSGWQANNLHDALMDISGSAKKTEKDIFSNTSKNIKMGILAQTNADSSLTTFTFFSRDSVNKSQYKLVSIDSALSLQLWQNTQNIFGNGLLAYPYNVHLWQKSIDDYDYWQRQRPVKIYPFTFSPDYDNWLLGYYFEKTDTIDFSAQVLIDIPNSGINFGRISLPVYNEQGMLVSHFAFDIVLNYASMPVTDPMVGLVIVLIITFIFTNVFVIRRVSVAGNKIHESIIDKFKILKTGIKEISGGNLKHKLKFEGEDEFTELARHFNHMGERLEETIARASEKERLDQELSIAREVQLGILPAMLPDISGFEIAAAIETAQEVSGDFYDVILLEDGNVLFTIGDVSGKGSSAAFYMAQYISLFRFSSQFTAFPKEIASRINAYFTTHVQDRQIFITSIIGVLDCKSGKITIVRAGQNNPFIVPEDDETRELSINGMGIGLTRNETLFKKSMEKHQFTLKKGESFVMYTDGFNEATRIVANKEEQYGEEKVIDILNRSARQSATGILNTVIRDVEDFYNGQPKNDDLTFLIIKKL